MNRMKASFQQEILPLMEEVLDELDVPGMTIRLDSIELDLGDLRVDSLEEDFRWAVKRELRKELMAQLRGSGGEKPQHGNIVDHAQATSDLLSHILRHGFLPWWSSDSPKSLDQLVLEMVDQAPEQLRSLMPRLLQREQVRRRLAFSLPPDTLQTLLKHLNPEHSVSVTLMERFSEFITDSGRALQKSQRAIAQTARRLALACWELAQPAVIFSALIDAFFPPGKATLLPPDEAAIAFLPANLKTAALTAWKEAAARRNATTEADRSKQSQTQELTQEQPRQPHSTPVETIYLDNGGLVLIHLYLPILFEEFDLVDKDGFKNEEAVSKALSLLRYLVWADEEREEFQQALDKVLCGQLPEEAFSVSLPLSDREKQECDRLLDAINANWDPMKSSDAQGLRDTFLKREGRLSFNGNAWELKNDRKGWDILLEQLPWTIGIVKLPWMEFPLYVEW